MLSSYGWITTWVLGSRVRLAAPSHAHAQHAGGWRTALQQLSYDSAVFFYTQRAAALAAITISPTRAPSQSSPPRLSPVIRAFVR